MTATYTLWVVLRDEGDPEPIAVTAASEDEAWGVAASLTYSDVWDSDPRERD